VSPNRIQVTAGPPPQSPHAHPTRKAQSSGRASPCRQAGENLSSSSSSSCCCCCMAAAEWQQQRDRRGSSSMATAGRAASMRGTLSAWRRRVAPAAPGAGASLGSEQTPCWPAGIIAGRGSRLGLPAPATLSPTTGQSPRSPYRAPGPSQSLAPMHQSRPPSRRPVPSRMWPGPAPPAQHPPRKHRLPARALAPDPGPGPSH
jgi:hypothetical protein